ncbi:nuclease-related domain-containing protein [Jeongeupia naejangsanensis]|uniref:NERD domain-containing protein n=1 Tax=Jeongeupia naejangsanensis TaxID=613195 RepID=A0ABS2BLC6_9NEIS|nr:NERD domain-containing protein [Jeongeupia naejangsanensis]MBM3116422.1 NERD domain-containing protein [Jeongeupia naejangsanensis]
MTAKLSETIINESLEKLSWKQLSSHLAATTLTEEDANKLTGLVKRAESLVLKRKNPSQETKRDELLQKLANFLDAKNYPNQAEFVRNYDARLKEIDSVYKGILVHLAKTDAAALTPELRVSALLDRANREYNELQSRMLQGMQGEGVLDLGKVTLRDDDGRAFSPDAVHELIVATFASTLGMEAHIHGWYDPNGVLTLPSLPPSTEENRLSVGSVQLLAASWRSWQFAERRHRFLDGALEKCTELDPSWTNRGFTSLWQSRPADDLREFHDYLANNRLAERLRQHWVKVLSNPKYRRAVAGIDGQVELLPKNAISLDEIHGATALSQLLSGAITEDCELYAGLTLAEWVRGYSALQSVCAAAIARGDPDHLTIRFSRPDLVALLERLGLQNSKAEVFVNHATYRKASRDLFDQPLIKLQDGSLILLALSGATSSIPNVILSTLGMLEVNLDGRGKRFERYIIEFLGRQGIKAKNIVCKRGGEIYDYDVAFVWGDYLFLLECKSRGLSGGDPTKAYYFSLGIRDVIKQVKRLADGLERYPDILTDHFPEAVGKQVVHCVINSLPYAVIDGIDDIHFTDEGSFTRFFQQSEIGPRSFDRDKGLGDIDPGTAVAFLWDGPCPTPEDLLRQLKNPIQLAISTTHTTLSPLYVPVGEQTALQLIAFGSTDTTLASHRQAAREAGYRSGGDPSDLP